MKDKKILVIEDDRMLSTIFKMFLSELGYSFVGFFMDAEEALEKMPELRPDAVLMDIHLPGKIDGIRAAEIIYQKYDIPVIYLTSDTKEATWQRALTTNSYGYLLKPVNKALLGITIEMALAKHFYDKEIKRRESRYRTLIEDSPDTIVVLTDNKIEFVNYAGLKLFETLYIEELLEKNIFDFVDSESQSIVQEKIAHAVSNKTKTGTFTFILHNINKKSLTIEAMGSHIEFKNKCSVQMIFRRIADFSSPAENNPPDKAYTSELSTDQHAFNALLNSSQEAIFLLDKKEKVILGNKAGRRFVSNILRRETSFDKPVFEILNFLDKIEFQSLFVNTFQGITHYLSRVFLINDQKYFFKITIFPLVTGNDKNIDKICVSIFDLSDKKNTEIELQQIKTDILPLFDSSIQRFYLVEFDYTIVAFNKAAANIIRDEFNHNLEKGDNLLDFIPFEKKDQPGFFIEKFVQARQGEHVIYRQRLNIDGQEQWAEAHLEPVLNEKGEIYRVLMWTLDVSKEKLSEDALIESQKKYYSLFSEASDAIIIVDHEQGDVMLDCNSKSCELFGYKKEEMLGMNLLLLSPPKQPSGSASDEKRDRKIKEAYEGISKPFYWCYKRKGGELFDAEVSLTVIKLENDKKYLYAMIRDISERKKLEKSLIDQQQKVKSLFEAIPDAVFIINKEGLYTDYKADIKNSLGSYDMIIGRNIEQFFKGEKLAEVKNKMNSVLETGEVQTAIYDLNTRKGVKKLEARISKLNENEVLSIVREIG
ncbi:MAG: hypothetical protein A2W91_00515 [Bacteroidetes bacterium GWF2_38_335]|nr:MAG: hypothetical protein A2W91_00515 [Bacteroidetes bacterium GWF2_38_335]OFY78315.1 MAG: hypothetical protein A2281_03895 [Bacteroidetes bacterium RIFOXYA12_FULL_38_20]